MYMIWAMQFHVISAKIHVGLMEHELQMRVQLLGPFKSTVVVYFMPLVLHVNFTSQNFWRVSLSFCSWK